MGLITKTYTPGNIFQGPVDLYVGITPPPSSAVPTADVNCLTLDANGQPSSATGFHAGHIEGPTSLSITEKVSEVMDDQHDVAIDVAFVSVEAQMEFTMKELNLSRLQQLISAPQLSAYNAIGGEQALQIGGQNSAAIGPTTLLLVTPRRDNPGKFLYAMFYRAYLGTALQTQFHRPKESVWKVTMKALMDMTRVTGDELAQIVRQQ